MCASRPSRSAGWRAGSAAVDAWTRKRSNSGQLPKPLGLGKLLQLLQRVVLDLADALAGDAERAPHLFERQRLVAAQPVAQLDHLALALGKGVQRLLDVLALEPLGRRVERLLRAVVRHEVAQLRLLLVADWLLERDRHLRHPEDVAHLANGDLELLGDLGRL